MTIAPPGIREKRCFQCRETKPLNDFHVSRASSDGRNSRCKLCNTAQAAAWRKQNPDRYLDRYLRRKYGISLVHYRMFLMEQNGRCAVCHRTPEEVGGRHKLLDVDHNHQTGEVRGLLCTDCNRAIGMLSDDPARLRAAAAYLES